MLTARYTHICGGGVGLKKFRISARLLLRRVRSAWLPANDPESRGSHGVRLVDARAQSDDIRRRKKNQRSIRGGVAEAFPRCSLIKHG